MAVAVWSVVVLSAIARPFTIGFGHPPLTGEPDPEAEAEPFDAVDLPVLCAPPRADAPRADADPPGDDDEGGGGGIGVVAGGVNKCPAP